MQGLPYDQTNDWGGKKFEETLGFESGANVIIDGKKYQTGHSSSISRDPYGNEIAKAISRGDIIPIEVPSLASSFNPNMSNIPIVSFDSMFNFDSFKANNDNNAGTTNHYNINKIDVVVKEPMENADELIKELANGVEQNNAITKNMRR